jgi:hypothetical protein
VVKSTDLDEQFAYDEYLAHAITYTLLDYP